MTTIEQQAAQAWGDYANRPGVAELLTFAERSAAVISRALDANETIMSAVHRECSHVDYGYPHPGCAEFGPPDEFSCTKQSTIRVIVQYPPQVIDPLGDADFPGDEHPDIAVVLLCDEHGAAYVENEDEREHFGETVLHVERLDGQPLKEGAAA